MFSVNYLNVLRAAEIEKIARHFRPAGARVLEIGAGTGRQAQELSKLGFDVEAIEIPSSNYAQARMFDITDFDGNTIPFPDASFDIVFSSNVLEHVPNLENMHRQIRRVLKPEGYAVHVLPTHAWRLWTSLSSFPATVQHLADLAPSAIPRRGRPTAELRRLATVGLAAAKHIARPFRRHGERGNVVSETWLFHPNWWRRNFSANGFDIIHDEPMGLFYTGNMTLGSRWSLEKRARVAKRLGSACHIFELKARQP
ncbi:MAG: class I SAM-dependent methyltransferase [Pseudomonadota bacterium]